MQKACIVIPCYNESKRLDFDAFDAFITSESTIDLLFSNDGSTDNTRQLIENFVMKYNGRVKLFNMPQNAGKAEAVRCGVLEAGKDKSYEFIGFWDADLATPLNEVPIFLNQVKDHSKKIAIGSRMKRLGAIVERKASRHLLGRVFSTFSSIILKLPVYDTQCGAKIFSSELLFLFEEKFITSWLFDVELIARYRNKFGIKGALSDIVEVPINTWLEKGGSKLKLSDMIKVPLELLSIHKKYN
ncbi:MAG: glycosyltransferase family 2 protein [Bacteroidetes bacterium]|nr:glycosyltransferase family 2 protein [Bacteroidota bacterium]